MDFKQRVKNSLILGAGVYKSVLLDFEYLIYSPGFIQNPYYIISANEDNYEHLTGVHSLISPKMFYAKCINGTITELDFDFSKGQKSEKSIKGTVRKKITAFPTLNNLFSSKLYAEENFTKGAVHCSIATADFQLTLGFINAKYAIPMTLLKGNQLNPAKNVEVTLVLRRKKGSDDFDVVIQGSSNDLLHLTSKCISMLTKRKQ